MQNNKEIINSGEQINEQDAHIHEDELEFVSADADVQEYSAPEEMPAEAEAKQEDVAESVENTREINEEPLEETENDDTDDGEVSPAYLVKLVLTLAVICMVIALLLSFVNSITKDRIAENIAKQQEAAILSIFPDGTDTEEHITAEGETVYIVNKDGEAIGYCVNSSGTGFGGPVQVMVGFKTDKTVKGIKIVSMSETPGIGTKVQGESFLGQFFGITSADDVDIISGATFSSKAVIEAVGNAMEIEFDISGVHNGDATNEMFAADQKNYVDTVNVPVAGTPEITDSTVIYTVEIPEKENESPWEGFIPNVEEQN